MRHATTTRTAFILSLAGLSLAVACSGTTPTPPGGSGGNPASGGAVGSSGGAPSTGGAVSTSGGAPSTGGVASTGGAVGSSGGAPSTGGAGAAPGTGGGSGAIPEGVYVDLAAERQIIRGFGINATIMPSDETLPWAQLFTLEGANALGLSILRIGMREDGAHRDVPSGWEVVRDSYNARVIGSCWSAPGEWKDNGVTVGGGHLEEDWYDEWATRIAEYAAEHELYAMSVGNETDFASCDVDQGRPCTAPLTDRYESMVYTGEELAKFVEIAGPIFEDIAPTTLMIAPEASLWIHVWSNLSPTNAANGGYDSSDPLGCDCFSNTIDPTAAATCAPHCLNGSGGELSTGGYDYGHWLASNPAAWDAFDILGVHEYESQVGYAWPADVTGGVRTKEVWQTEMSGVMHWPEQGPTIDIDNGLAVARWIHSALTVGEASAWLYWWYEAYYQNDNEGLALLKTRDGQSNPTDIAKRYYTMGNFSRYIRPDVFHAVAMGGNGNADVMLSAYKGDGGELVVVAINEGDAEVSVPITVIGGTAPAMLTPTVTSASGNWVDGTPVAVTGGVLTAVLPAKSVTTFH